MKLKAEKSIDLGDLPVEVLTGTKGNKSVRVCQGGKDSDPINNMLVNGSSYAASHRRDIRNEMRRIWKKAKERRGRGSQGIEVEILNRAKRKTREGVTYSLEFSN
jgi:hypothetical protein